MKRDRASNQPFTLAKLMVLIAATGAGLAMFRPYSASLAGPGWSQYLHLRTIETIYGAWSFIAAWLMIALLLLQYQRPHPRRGRLARRPGHAACCVAALALAVGAVHELTRFAFRALTERPSSFHESWVTVSARVGPAIAGAWLLLALSGRWRSDPGWSDRLGRLLGCCWIGWLLFWTIPDPIRIMILRLWEGLLS